MVKRFLACVAVACVLVISGSVSTVTVDASGLEDSVGGGSGFFGSGSVDAEDQAIGDWVGGQRGMTSDNLNNASKTLSPLTGILGNVVGGIFVLTFTGVFVITALDLLYISIPPFRNMLYKGNAGGGGGAMMGGGMMGRGGMMGGNPGMAAEARPVQWISDEAVQCAAMLGNGGSAGGGAMAGGMMSGGMMGGGMMGGMQQQQSGANLSMKSVIGMYFKKRLFFMVLLAVCAIVLTSSVLLGTGVNLANWVIKILGAVNNNIPK